MQETILVINAGSSSIKFQLFAVAGDDRLARRMRGQIEGIGGRPCLLARDVDGRTLIEASYSAADVGDVPAALCKVIAFLREQIGGSLAPAELETLIELLGRLPGAHTSACALDVEP